MLIQILETRRGSEDAHTVRRFHKGDVVDMADSEARRFLSAGWAEVVQRDNGE